MTREEMVGWLGADGSVMARVGHSERATLGADHARSEIILIRRPRRPADFVLRRRRVSAPRGRRGDRPVVARRRGRRAGRLPVRRRAGGAGRRARRGPHAAVPGRRRVVVVESADPFVTGPPQGTGSLRRGPVAGGDRSSWPSRPGRRTRSWPSWSRRSGWPSTARRRPSASWPPGWSTLAKARSRARSSTADAAALLVELVGPEVGAARRGGREAGDLRRRAQGDRPRRRGPDRRRRADRDDLEGPRRRDDRPARPRPSTTSTACSASGEHPVGLLAAMTRLAPQGPPRGAAPAGAHVELARGLPRGRHPHLPRRDREDARSSTPTSAPRGSIASRRSSCRPTSTSRGPPSSPRGPSWRSSWWTSPSPVSIDGPARTSARPACLVCSGGRRETAGPGGRLAIGVLSSRRTGPKPVDARGSSLPGRRREDLGRVGRPECLKKFDGARRCDSSVSEKLAEMADFSLAIAAERGKMVPEIRTCRSLPRCTTRLITHDPGGSRWPARRRTSSEKTWPSG